MDAELIEAVARAICIATGIEPDRKGNERDWRWQEFEPEARAAIAAVERYRAERKRL